MLIYLDRYNFSDPTVEAHAAPQQMGAGYRPRSRPVSVAIRSATTGILRTARF
jgi:hypothetical protein